MMTALKRYTEGRATFFCTDVEHYIKSKKQPTADMPVFYNPRMRLNRDLSVVFLSAYLLDKKIDLICEPLAGSGVRTIRYLMECPGDFRAVMFDTNPVAVETAIRNLQLNSLENRARVIKGDARLLLIQQSHEHRFDFVDVDPFGSPVPFLNAAIQAMSSREGLLALTATDMPPLCGIHPRVALRKYGGLSVRAPFSHEIAVRLLIAQAVRVAGMNDRAVEPLVSLSSDHYIRSWLRVRNSKAFANIEGDEMGMVRFCPSCMNTEIIPLRDLAERKEFAHIENCTGKVRIAGPLWIGKLSENTFLETARKCITENHQFHKRVSDVLNLMIEEHSLTDRPYIDLHALCDTYGISPPKRQLIMSRLMELGHRSVRTHFRPTAIRTEARVKEVLEVIRDIIGGI